MLSFPYSLRFLLANNPQVMGKVLGIVNRVISTQLIKKVGFKRATVKTGAVTPIQRFGSNQVGKITGFSLPAGEATKRRERKKLARLCRYISRPAGRDGISSGGYQTYG